MGVLRAASGRWLLRHPLQLVLAMGGLALGVATVTAVDIATTSARRAFALTLDAVQGAATHEIRSGPAGIDESLYVQLRRAHPSLDFAPLVEGYVTLGGRSFQLVGIDGFADPGFRGAGGLADSASAIDDPIERLADWIARPGALALSARSARELGLALGSPAQLEIAGRVHSARVAGLFGEQRSGADTLLVADIAQAQEWLGLVGRLSRISVRAADDAAGHRALEALRAELPAALALTGTQRSTARSLDMTAAFTTNLEAMSLLALLVAVFLIYSAISFSVVQRRRTLGILRALGATRAEILGLILAEAALLGLAGALLGIGLGALIGRELIALVTRTINDLYFVLAVNQTELPPSALAKALAIGLGAALVAAALPALEVVHSPPQLGMRRSALERRAHHLARWLVPASGLAAGASALLVAASERSLAAGLAALFLLLFAVALVTPAVLRGLARVSARALGHASPVARLAVGDVSASLSRTGVAVAALGMAIAAAISVAVMVHSFRETLVDWLDVTLQADVYVAAPGAGFGRPERQLDPELVDTLLALDGVVEHSAVRRVDVDSPSGPIALQVFALAPRARASFELVTGDAERAWQAWEDGALLVSEPLAWRLRLAPGDVLPLRTRAGLQDFEVAGIYRDFVSDRGSALLERSIYVERFGDPALSSLTLYLAPGASPAALIPRIHAAAAGRQALYVSASADLRRLSLAVFDRTFTITRVLYWLAAGVAALGLVSALLAWELERAREIAILRALGLTPAGTAGMIALQTGFMGLAAWLAALPAGLLAAILLIDVVNRRAFGWQIDLHVRADQIGDALVLALGAALVAGLYPAWRAARAPLARAVREE